MPTTDILFTRQTHDAKRMGRHWDYRIVIGDKAYSWATRKQMPEQGRSIILHEQPIHDREYALSKKVVIPDGNYGAGVTVLDWARKGKIENKGDHYVITASGGKERYLLKKIESYGPKQWLFVNLPMEKKAEDIHSKFQPDLTPEEMDRLGVLVGKYSEGDPRKGNFFKVDASMKEWPENWHNDQHPLGWYEWYKGYSQGKRTDDDERQIKRWISFKARHLAQLKKADPTLTDLSIQPRRRQALLHWGIAPGIGENKYIERIKSSTGY